jgi:hypothetical protein
LTGDTSPTSPRSTPSEAEPEEELELPHPIKNKDKNKALIIQLIFFITIFYTQYLNLHMKFRTILWKIIISL